QLRNAGVNLISPSFYPQHLTRNGAFDIRLGLLTKSSPLRLRSYHDTQSQPRFSCCLQTALARPGGNLVIAATPTAVYNTLATLQKQMPGVPRGKPFVNPGQGETG
ncbi:MAG: hypothetical protein ACLU38_07630, partial [Dysosmobacter sp.]